MGGTRGVGSSLLGRWAEYIWTGTFALHRPVLEGGKKERRHRIVSWECFKSQTLNTGEARLFPFKVVNDHSPKQLRLVMEGDAPRPNTWGGGMIALGSMVGAGQMIRREWLNYCSTQPNGW